MNKPTDFARSLADYFTNYMAGQRNLSVNTIRSYRDTFCLLLTYLEAVSYTHLRAHET